MKTIEAMKTQGVPFPLATIVCVDESTIHTCEQIKYENRNRVCNGENTVSVFCDYDNYSYLRVGFEFVKINACPFCGSQL